MSEPKAETPYLLGYGDGLLDGVEAMRGMAASAENLGQAETARALNALAASWGSAVPGLVDMQRVRLDREAMRAWH